MRRPIALAWIAALVLAATPAFAGDAPKTKKIANPEFANWSKFAVGALVELTSVSETMGQKSTSKMTHKLVELTAEKAVVETTIAMEGMPAEFAPPPQRRDVPKEVEVPDVPTPTAPTPDMKVVEGEETIDVAGTSMKCKTTETTLTASGMTTKTKTWMSDDLPGITAKMEMRSEGKVGEMSILTTSSTTVTKWAAK